ncbi:MAG TPA: hypothetical protein VJT70_06590 [Sphingomicrobium sp.]|nr:hypothetical protein [Sphingomicrobium sp.]
MGAPGSGTKAADQPSAETLLTAFKKIDAAERRRHASVLNYWLSIRGDKEFPPLHDLDPLELSDAGPNSILMELISGGHDAEIRHMGEALRDNDWPERIMDADNPSILSCIAKKLPIVAISRDFLAFEDEFDGGEGPTRCWVTLLPLSAGGAWVDYVYALVSLEGPAAKAAKPAKAKKAPEPELEPEIVDEVEEVVEEAEEPVEEIAEPVEEVVEAEEAVAEDSEESLEAYDEQVDEPAASAVAKAAPGFSKLLDSIAGLTGFYGSQPVKVEPVIASPDADDEPVEFEEQVEEPVAGARAEEIVAEEPAEEAPAPEPVAAEKPAKKAAEQPTRASEGSLQSKLADVRAKADEARMAKLRANAALYEGLSAAYDFALDAEETPEEYLKLVEAQGLKIQLRSPMKPVVKLAFDGMCDDMTIKQLEAVLAWAFEEELPRGALAERLEASGGIGRILNGEAKAA